MSKEKPVESNGVWEDLIKRVKEFSPKGHHKIVHYEYFVDGLRILLGKVLTIIDASIADKQQKKCVKDLIRSEFYRKLTELDTFYFGDNQGSVNCSTLESNVPESRD